MSGYRGIAAKHQPVPNQAIEVGRTHDVMVQVSDPDGDPITLSASSSDGGILSAVAQTNAMVRMVGQAAGNASVTVTATDGRGGTVSTVFLVTVGLANRPPSVDPIGAQELNVGETRDVGYNASDPDGDTLTASAVSNNPGVVASVSSPGVIRLVAARPGSRRAAPTGRKPPVTTTFGDGPPADRPPVVERSGRSDDRGTC